MRTLINLLLDTFLLFILLSLVASAAIVRFVFPPGTVARGWTLWGFDYDAWANIQFINLCIILMAIVVHVMLHWNWVCSVIAARILKLKGTASRPDDGIQTLYGVATLITFLGIIGLLMAVATLTIEHVQN